MSDGRTRRKGAGRRPFVEHHLDVIKAIEKIIDGQTYGDPSKMLHWVPQSMSLRKIEAILIDEYGIQVSYVKVSQLLTDMGYSKQVNQKMLQLASRALTVMSSLGSSTIWQNSTLKQVIL